MPILDKIMLGTATMLIQQELLAACEQEWVRNDR